MRRCLTFLTVAVLPLLGGCQMVLLNPAGDVAVQQRNLIFVAAVLMLIVVLPVMGLTVYFAWRYRASAKADDYDPDWHHSTRLELLIWSAPLAIIIALGAVTWVSTHTLDPYRPLARIAPGKPLHADSEPLEIDVVSLDWKWLFIYPQQGIAVVNQMAAPVNRPISFKITSSDLMNSFFVPAVAGQIYSMAGMETKLHAVVNTPGTYKGFSANYSGRGFSDMHFKFLGLSDKAFQTWVEKAKASTTKLDRTSYLALARPSVANPVAFYGSFDTGLYDAILNQCASGAQMCIRDLMAYDARAGGGLFAPLCKPSGKGIGGSTALDGREARNLSDAGFKSID